MVSTTGWNAINSISGASVLYALSDGKCPQWAGVIIICTTVWIICALGITWIHRLDAVLWIPPFIVWCVAAGTGASHFTGAGIKSPTSANGAAAALSFIAVIFSFAVSWVNCAADYNVRMPVNTPHHKIFVATYIGIAVPAILVQVLGAAVYSGTFVNAAWKLAYHEAGVGGPLKLALEPAGGFGKFLLVLAALSSIPVWDTFHCLLLYLFHTEQYPKQLFICYACPELRAMGSPDPKDCSRHFWLCSSDHRRYLCS